MYTLEKHLESTINENAQFEILNAIWKLNKKQLPLAQSAIAFNFPHYSLHEKSHSDTIIKNIESFLGESRIKSLSPTDTWMLLMAAYTHDLGMIVFNNAIEEKWLEESFQDYLSNIARSSNDKDLKSAAELLLEIQNAIIPTTTNKRNASLDIRRAVILITADFFRRTHPQRSSDMIKGKDTVFNKLVDNFNLTGVPGRFANCLGDIAYSHGIDFYSVLDSLEYQSDGFASDKMHPRFVACMLRLGDLLDIDDKRFNVFNEKVYGSALPHVSALHSEKHASTKHLLISPYSIEATVDCKTDEVYRVAREWFDWLKLEVENQSREWSKIAPENSLGMPPTISRDKLKVLFKSNIPKDQFLNLRFAISNKKVFEMFEGSAIYDNAEFVFLRELVQNAIDASKIQLWKTIQLGVYDFFIREHLDLPKDASHDDIIKAIIFPSDLPAQLLEGFQVDLSINWYDEKKKHVLIQITDRGTGISESDLLRMTQQVGESRSNDKEYHKFRESMPYWMRPTGAFGIGLQSLFLLTPSFTVCTKTHDEPGKEIVFQSAKNGEYSRIVNDNLNMDRGTTVSIKIANETFDEIFSNTFNTAVIDNYDFFTDNFGGVYMHKMRAYIENELGLIKPLNVNMFEVDVLISEAKKRNNSKWDFLEPIESGRDEKIMYSMYENTPYPHSFRFSEKLIVGF
ncbi:MAG: ATP-binding protein [Chitinophagaceae bacterium]